MSVVFVGEEFIYFVVMIVVVGLEDLVFVDYLYSGGVFIFELGVKGIVEMFLKL